MPSNHTLYDFDDAAVDRSARAGAKRWLAGFNGRIGEPAHDVQLAWRGPTGAQVAVGTFPSVVDERRENHRISALWMLDSVQFYRPGPPATPSMLGFEQAQQLSQDDGLWDACDLLIDAIRVPASLAEVGEAVVAHSEDGSVVVASIGVPLDQLRVRRVPSPAVGYPVDPWRPQTVAALESEWDEFFQDRPDLKPA